MAADVGAARSNVRLSVVIPVYNERDTIRPLVESVARVPLPIEREIIIVDDCSTDQTGAICDGLSRRFPGLVRVFRHRRNRGKGAAVRTGFAAARGDILVVQDADLEYDPRDYAALLGPILQGRADVVYGSRFLGRRDRRFLGWRHVLANKMLTCLSNTLGGPRLTDMCTCYKMLRASVLEGIQLRQDRFAFDAELTMKLGRKRWRVLEVPVAYTSRPREQGKKITWRDFLEHVITIVRCSVAL